MAPWEKVATPERVAAGHRGAKGATAEVATVAVRPAAGRVAGWATPAEAVKVAAARVAAARAAARVAEVAVTVRGAAEPWAVPRAALAAGGPQRPIAQCLRRRAQSLCVPGAG